MLSMSSTEVCILNGAHEVIFSSLLQHLDSVYLEMQVICSMFLHYLTHQVCKRQLTDKELCASLIWHISWRATIPCGYLWGLISPPLRNSLWSLPASSGLHVTCLPLDAVVASSASAAIQAYCLVGDIPSNLPAPLLLCPSGQLLL